MNYIIFSGAVSLILIILVVVSFLKYGKKDYDKYKDEFSAYKILFIGEYITRIITRGKVLKVESKSYRKYHENYLKLFGPRNADEFTGVHFYAKYSMMIFALLIFMLLGFLVSISTYMESMKAREVFEEVIERPEYREEEISKDYVVKIENDGKVYEDRIQVVIPEKEPSLEQIRENIEKTKERIYKYALNGNESFDTVKNNLNLYENDKYYDAILSWEVSDEQIMTNKGKIDYENLIDNTSDIMLFVTITVNEVSETYEIPVSIIKPNPLSLVSIVKKDLNIALADEGRRVDNVYNLPDNIQSLNEKLVVNWSIYEEEVSYDKSILIIFLGLILSLLFFKVSDNKLEEKLTEKKNKMQMQFPIFADKFTLLYSCGISPVEAVKTYLTSSIKSNEEMNYFDKELQIMIEEIELGGEALDDAFLKFGKRSRVPDILKFTTLIAQDINKGDKNVVDTINKLVSEAWAERKKLVLELGNKASTKLLLPMMIMLFMVIIIVIAPAINTFNKF